MKKVCFIQPLITNYTIPIFAELGKHTHLTIVYSPVDTRQGFESKANVVIPEAKLIEVPTWWPPFGRNGMVQCGLIRILKDMQPDAVIIFANLRYLSFWSVLAWCKLQRIPVFPHGHGLYKKRSPGFLWKVIYRIVFWLSTVYISYTPSVAESLSCLGLPKKKIAVAENSIENLFAIPPEQKTGRENGILFIGRLREGCRLDLLLSVVAQIHVEHHSDIMLHIIGDGIDTEHFKSLASGMSWVKFHGSIYDPEKISEISRQCMAGCYPGNAGLSIVHLMSLSLPPITHDMLQHQGPEPSYIENGVNGVLFDYSTSDKGLVSALRSIVDHPEQLRSLQYGAYSTYKQLTDPSLAVRFVNIITQADSKRSKILLRKA